MNFKVISAAAVLLASQAFAIVGIGGHYAPGFGTKMSAGEKTSVMKDVDFERDGFSGTMQGFGFKLWVDILPIFDVEATYNIQYSKYDASLYVDGSGKTVNLEFDPAGTPFGKSTPKFVQNTLDLSLTYPITFIPIIRPYIGGGFTYHRNTFVLNEDFVGDVAKESSADKLSRRVQDAASDESLKSSAGGHILVGTRAKLPFIPFAAYCNFKYYIGGDYPKEIDAGNMTLEVGGGFAL
jgi:hypothetical protein